MRLRSNIEYIKKFAKNVRLRRYQLEISQEELAELIDCHVNHIGRIERGQADPSLSMMVRIANALSIPLKELIP
jgi:transcriptional regulator with XRE-family HTH domain